jgi:hypothetical protein
MPLGGKKSKSKDNNIEVLSPKQNGNAGVESDQASAKANKSTIKGMWKKAFKSLKSRDKDKEREKEKDRDRDRESREREKEREKDLYKDDRSSEKSEDSGRYSRQTSRQSSLKRVLMRKDSKEAASDSEQQPPSEPPDPVFNTLKMAASIRKPGLVSGGQSVSVSSEEAEHFEPIQEEEMLSSAPSVSASASRESRHHRHRGKHPHD